MLYVLPRKLSQLICVIALLVVGPSNAAESFAFYYFNPDSPQRNLGQLQHDVVAFFTSREMDVAFQPFGRLLDFDREMHQKPPALVLVPDWYWQRYSRELKLRPVLRALHQGKPSYKKQLIANVRAPTTLKHTQQQTLAMTTLGPDGTTLLNQILFAKRDMSPEKLSIVEVPKDADAVFAVALGQVDMALVSDANMQQLAQINPRLTDAVRAIDETLPIALPVLCVVDGNMPDETLRRVEDFLSSGKEGAVVLHIDAWRAAQ